MLCKLELLKLIYITINFMSGERNCTRIYKIYKNRFLQIIQKCLKKNQTCSLVLCI